jgi:hypothetical protein
MNNNDIIAFCKDEKPTIIYLAIGPARSAPQQYPPFLNEIDGKHICLLFDPRMEDPLSVFVAEDSHLVMENDGVRILSMPRHFDWAQEDDRSFVHELCKIAIEGTNTRLIVQDYTGRDIREDYPIRDFGIPLLRRVLFDVTYVNSGCFVDFSQVRLYTYPNGSFLQPFYDRISTLLPYVSKDTLAAVVQDRNSRLVYNAMRLYRVLCGTEEAPEWCTEEAVFQKIRPLLLVYGFDQTELTKELLGSLLLAYLMDLLSYRSEKPKIEDAVALIRESGMNKSYSIFGIGYEKLVQETKRLVTE